MDTKDTKDLMWNVFCNTGNIGNYLLYNKLSQEEEKSKNGADKNQRTGSSECEYWGLR